MSLGRGNKIKRRRARKTRDEEGGVEGGGQVKTAPLKTWAHLPFAKKRMGGRGKRR
jgi:hypothetical protein